MTWTIETVGTGDPVRWNGLLAGAGAHDFYHTAEYHALAEQNGEGEAVLIALQSAAGTIALPLILRPVDRIASLADVGKGLKDATSVYGYCGPVGPVLEADNAMTFTVELERWLAQHSVVSLFSRLHPLIESNHLFNVAEKACSLGPTIAIDLALSDEEQVAQYRPNHRRDLRKLRQRGFSCRLASGEEAVDTFGAVYRETMLRVDATPDYFFDRAYISALLAIDGLDVMLCENGSDTCAAAIISRYGPFSQYHLGGTFDSWLSQAPMKLIFDETRILARDSGCRWLHLGGGIGAREDALFGFKAGFSDIRKSFQTWRWIIDEPTYGDLCKRAGIPGDSAFFPAYASPALPTA